MDKRRFPLYTYTTRWKLSEWTIVIPKFERVIYFCFGSLVVHVRIWF